MNNKHLIDYENIKRILTGATYNNSSEDNHCHPKHKCECGTWSLRDGKNRPNWSHSSYCPIYEEY